jgi:hypothetical protein
VEERKSAAVSSFSTVFARFSLLDIDFASSELCNSSTLLLYRFSRIEDKLSRFVHWSLRFVEVAFLSSLPSPPRSLLSPLA